MHTTQTGERIKALKTDIQQYQKEVRMLSKIPAMNPALKERQAEIDRLTAEIVALETSGKARIEDLHVWQMEKVKGSKTYTYWMASWREDEKVHNAHLGSTKKLSKQEALEKARKMKTEALSNEEQRGRPKAGIYGRIKWEHKMYPIAKELHETVRNDMNDLEAIDLDRLG